MKRFPVHAAIVAVTAAALVLVVFSCGPAGRKRAVVVGMIAPFSGEGAHYGETARTGIDMAVDEINAAGGIQGRDLQIQYEDSKGTVPDGLAAFHKLVSVDKVPAVIGPFYSLNLLAIAPEANRQQVVILSGSTTSDSVREAGDYIYRVCPSNNVQAKTAAQYAARTLGATTAFVIYRDEDYGETLRDSFKRFFEEVGGKVLGAEAVAADADAEGVRAQLRAARASGAGVIFAAVFYPEGGTLLRGARALGIRAPIIGSDGGYDPQLVAIAGDAAEGSYWVTIGWEPGIDTANRVAAFQESYRARYNDEPGIYSGLYYDATKVLAIAMNNARDLSGRAIREALQQVDYTGPTGRSSFDGQGDVDKDYVVYEVQDGDFVEAPGQ
jgi:branched-chain amino acid transport system substrate-binding protein